MIRMNEHRSGIVSNISRVNDKDKADFINRHPSTIKELTEKAESNPETLRDIDKDKDKDRDYIYNNKISNITKENVINHTFLTEPKMKNTSNIRLINNNTQIPPIKESAFKASNNDDNNEDEEEEEDDDNEDEEEENEDQEEEEEGEDSNQGTRTNLKEEFNLREPEYKKRIEQLERELLEEKNKSSLKNNNNNNDIIANLKSQIQAQDNQISKLSKSNTKQRKQLEELSQYADSKLKSINYRQISKRKPNLPSENIDNLDFETTIKRKDRQLTNALSLVEILSKDNANFKAKFNSLGDEKEKISLNDKLKEDETQLTNRQNQLKQLRKKVEEHSNCEKTQQMYEHNIKSIRDDINHYKAKNAALEEKIQERERNLISFKKKSIESSPNKQKSYNPKVLLKRRLLTEVDEVEMNNKAELLQKVEKILTPNELNAIKCTFVSRVDYERIVKYIITMTAFLNSMESKHKNDIKKHLERLNELDEEIEYMNLIENKNEARREIYKAQLSEWKANVTNYQKKVNEMQVQITKMNSEVQNKDNQIKALTIKLASLRTMIQNAKASQLDKTISHYITNVKNENKH